MHKNVQGDSYSIIFLLLVISHECTCKHHFNVVAGLQLSDDFIKDQFADCFLDWSLLFSL